MAKWINVPVVGGVTNAAGATPADDQNGDNLILASDIVTVKCTVLGSGAFQGEILLTGGKKVTTLIATDSSNAAAANSPDDNAPSSTDYINKFKDAINRAITANPGGVKSTVSLPQDQDSQAKYSFGKTVYFRHFLYS
tara:strand:- start:1540 stop:1953 length:414 start_codon:yes stop_codon:yes gene_type:complete